MSLSMVSIASPAPESLPEVQESLLGDRQELIKRVSSILPTYNYGLVSLRDPSSASMDEGLYAMFLKDECLYVGESECIIRRLWGHQIGGNWNFSDADVVTISVPGCTKTERLALEKLLTAALDPIFGRRPRVRYQKCDRIYGEDPYRSRLSRIGGDQRFRVVPKKVYVWSVYHLQRQAEEIGKEKAQ